MGSMFPALDIKSPTPPLEQFSQAQQIVGQQQAQQLQALQIQEQTRLLRDQDATTRAMSSLVPDENGRASQATAFLINYVCIGH